MGEAAAAGAAAPERDVLLATKLRVPGLRPDLVPRPRLARRLEEGRGPGLVLVCAPAGYGKTVLVAEWVRRGRHRVAWLSLDAGDSDPARFWRHAVAALDRVRPGIGERVGPLLGPLPDAVAAALAARTEGWAAGLQLAGLSLRGQSDVAGFVAAFTGSHRYVLDYLAGEVLEQQGEQVREFLLETSVLERLSGELCDAVTGRPGSQVLLEQVERAGLFVVPLDEVRGWGRYHHLFGGLLRARLQAGQPGRVPGLHRNAAAWYAERGLADDAIRHAVAAGEMTWAARLIEQHFDELFYLQLAQAERTFMSSIAEWGAAGLPTLTAWVLYLLGQVQRARGALDASARTCRRALEMTAVPAGPMQASPDPAGPLNPVPAQRARLLLTQGDLAAAARWTQETGLGADDEPDYPSEQEHLVLARVLLAQDRPGQALALLARLQRALGAQDIAPGAGRGSVTALPGLAGPLTSRELEVLQMLAAGRSNQAIAGQLVVTLDTVKKHVSHVLGKLGAASRTEAIARARELSLIP